MPDQTRIFGGARLGPASDLADYYGAAGEWAKNTWIADFPEQQSIAKISPVQKVRWAM